jgi:hypothetical protein
MKENAEKRSRVEDLAERLLLEKYADELLTVEQLGKWLKKPDSWVYRHSSKSCPLEKRLPSVRLDRGLRFQRRAIQRWMDERSTTPQNARPDTREDAQERDFPRPGDDFRPESTENTHPTNGHGRHS